MINKHCKEFLSFLSEHEPDYDRGVYTYDWIEENYDEPIEDVYRMVRFLESEGYVKSATMNSDTFGIVLEEKGKYYNQFYWEELKDSFLKSIFLPVFVALLTYIATEFAGNVWEYYISQKMNSEQTNEHMIENEIPTNTKTDISNSTNNND